MGHIGTGGGLRYLSEEAEPNMVCQELPWSCQTACAFQLLKDAGIATVEGDLRLKAGYVDRIGTFSQSIAILLNELHPQLDYHGGSVAYPDIAIATLFRRDPWIASLQTDYGSRHAVIVDGCIETVVSVRDPWGLGGAGSELGSRASILVSEFMVHWGMACFDAIWPVRRK